jgi:hypothetical protein
MPTKRAPASIHTKFVEFCSWEGVADCRECHCADVRRQKSQYRVVCATHANVWYKTVVVEEEERRGEKEASITFRKVRV